jgi:ketosteroid isomerase-like protein
VSVLLRQPQGFEGLGLAVVAAYPDKPPVAPLTHLPDHLIDWDATFSAVAANTHSPHREIPKVAHFQGLRMPVGKDVIQVLVPAEKSLVAAIPTLFNRGQAREDLHVLVRQCQKGVEVAPVERVDGSVSQLHVLPRHRPRSIPQGDGRRANRERSRTADQMTRARIERGRGGSRSGGLGRTYRRPAAGQKRHATVAEQIIDAGDQVVIIAEWRGRGKASGVFTKWRYGAVWTLRDGKVTSIISYSDPVEALEAAGLSEQDAQRPTG